MKTLRQEFSVSYSYPVAFTRGVFGTGNPTLKNALAAAGAGPCKVMVIIDSNVWEAMPNLPQQMHDYACKYAEHIELVAPPLLVRGGEACKSDPEESSRVLAAIEDRGICRQSFLLVLGGGAVLDAAGYAGGIAHRGVRVIRMPTTVLAQNDAGVGVKNGINAFGKKNFLGTFAPPWAVINDFDFLDTLPERELRSGIAEAVKVALIKDATFFDVLYRDRHKLARFEPAAMETMIMRCAELHLEHIRSGGDPFEIGSARPLDFGHWAAHRLEELSGGGLRHGEAVAVGIALDSLYAHRTGLISEFEQERILTLLRDVGFDLWHWALQWVDIESSLEAFREHLGGELHLTLPAGIGTKVETTEIALECMRDCVGRLALEQSPTDRTENDHDGEHVPAVG